MQVRRSPPCSRQAARSEPPLEQKSPSPKGCEEKNAPLPVNGTEGAVPCSWNDQALLHWAPARNVARETFTTGCWPAFLTMWRGEVRERAVRTRRKPGEGKRREPGMLAKSPPLPLGSRNTAFPVHRPTDISSGANQAPAHGFHETRDTKHGVIGTEALQSCFPAPACIA